MAYDKSVPVSFKGNDIYYFETWVSADLPKHYNIRKTSYSVRPRSARVAAVRARRAADQLDDHWYHLRSPASWVASASCSASNAIPADTCAPMSRPCGACGWVVSRRHRSEQADTPGPDFINLEGAVLADHLCPGFSRTPNGKRHYFIMVFSASHMLKGWVGNKAATVSHRTLATVQCPAMRIKLQPPFEYAALFVGHLWLSAP
ncbi:MAG: DUF6538 domain-containing protein, partial [Pseudomonadota bacterium]